MSKPLTLGETVLLIDRRERRYVVTLSETGQFQTHAGVIHHEAIIGSEEGSTFSTASGAVYIAFRPTLAESILHMPRGAQVIYPKDLGRIIFMADIKPDLLILEAGVGSGALSSTLLQLGANVIGYEIREDFAQRAKQNVAGLLGEEALSRYNVEIRDIYDGITHTDLDRIILDLPEPWNVVKHANEALRPGGLIVSYSPSITQVVQFRESLDQSSFGYAETEEVLIRSWHIEGQSVRPDHRMVAHTGFLTVARRLGQDSV